MAKRPNASTAGTPGVRWCSVALEIATLYAQAWYSELGLEVSELLLESAAISSKTSKLSESLVSGVCPNLRAQVCGLFCPSQVAKG